MALDTAQAVAKLRSMTRKFDLGVKAATPFYPNLCLSMPSDGADEEYGAIGAMPGVREWLGDRQFNSLRGAKFTLANKKWESSVEIEKDNIDDDRLGLYPSILEQLGQEAAMHPDDLLFELIELGESTACFDSQYFFDTDHAMGDSGSQSNDITSAAVSATAPTEAEFRTAYHAARAAMLALKRDNGKPIHGRVVKSMQDLVLLVPPAFETTAVQALTKTLVNQGETNIVLDRPTIITSPNLTWTTKFALFRTGQIMKPFVFQQRQPIARQMKGLDDREFKGVKFMTDARYNVGFLAWWNAVLCTFTTP